MTDTTDIKALRPSDRAKLGFVTDDNTGGYYVAECEECGKIFPSQTCDGGGAIADTGDYGDCYCPHCGFIDPLECDNANLVWNVQQLKIVNLTKQLEAERQRADASQTLLMPEGLHENTKALVIGFANALAVKLHKAEKKYGYDNSWKNDNWQRECQRDLLAHVTKGDPLDVAAYCAFMWHHGWPTAPKPSVKGE